VNSRFFVPVILALGAWVVGGCLPARLVSETPAAESIPLVTPAVEQTPLLPAAELGSAENPLILALPPAREVSPQQVNAAREIAADFTARSGYVVVVTAPETYAALAQALASGNAHIALLDPLSYAFAYQNDLVRAQYAVVREEKSAYATQFLAPRRSGFRSYFNAEIGVNTADAAVALAQFADKKPCWSEETSLSGYLIPLGMLKQAQVQTRSAAFVGGQTTVVRSLYAGGICDFGAGYVDVRKFPSLEDSMPDLFEQVLVIWRSEEIIPYGVLVFSTKMPEPMRALFRELIPAIRQTEAGSAAFRTAYGLEEVQAVSDGDFRDFHTFMQATGLNLAALLEGR
jgi:ABC-type phosphate/phosphonate transport system substrate-binding protein